MLLLLASVGWNRHMQTVFERFANGYVHTPDERCKVLEAGAINFNGSPRTVFEARGCKYTGMDIARGRGVDVVYDPGQPFPFESGTFDLTISTSMFEHDPFFWLSLLEMARVTRLGGHVFATAPSIGPYHAHPGDNWRFQYDAVAALAVWAGRDGKAPLAVVKQTFAPDMWRSNCMHWVRVRTPATNITLGEPFDTGRASLGADA
jgi:SAM-dependent methyltransferase